MALTNSTHERKIYLSIINGKFAQKVEEGTANAVSRKNKKEAIVHELLHDKASGMIQEVKIEKNDFGKQLVIVMNDLGELYIITIPVESKYFDSFCSKIGNADLSMEIEIVPYSFQPKDKDGKRVGINLYQGGKKLNYYFSKEEPKGKPFPEKDGLDEDEWKMYKIKERKFFCDYIIFLSAPKNEVRTEIPGRAAPGDDLPF
jgi:DNA-binding TFAR19-related protein (PDSD5 family)